jgi:hypothetical protein
MKKSLFIILVLFSFNVFAQQDSIQFKTKFGIGVTFGQDINMFSDFDMFTYPMTIGNIYFPIDITPKFRLEPEFGYFRFKYEFNGSESTISNLRFGVGLFSITRYKNSIIQIGGRIGIINNSINLGNPIDNDDNSKDDYYFGFATGGEYLLSKHISLGGEAQINYITLGNYNDDNDSTTSIISTRALVILRIYY